MAPRQSILDYLLDINNAVGIYDVKRCRCTCKEYYSFFPKDENLCMGNKAFTTYLPNNDSFDVNVVTQFRSLPYTTWTDGNIEEIPDYVTPPMIPIRVERSI